MLVDVRAQVLLILSLVATPASAQSTSLPDGLDYPDRAMALRPTGMAVQRFGWSAMMWNGAGGPTDLVHDFAHEWEGRLPIESLLVEVAGSASFVWMRPPSIPDEIVVLLTRNVQIGAAFRDAPAPRWRYELGGALTVPSTTVTTLDGLEDERSYLPLRNLLGFSMSGWNAHRLRRDTFAVVPHARVEIDPYPELVVGLELDVPFVVVFATEAVEVRPQVALEVAGRFERTSLVGLRAELTSYPDVNVLLEPFVRVSHAHESGAPFLRVGLRLPLGPAYPFVTEAPLGYLGATVEAGALL